MAASALISLVALLALYLLGALLLLLILAFLFYTVYLYWIHGKYAHLPEPTRPSFYLGHIPDLLRIQKEMGNPELSLVPLILQWQEQIGSHIFVVYFLYRPVVMITDAESVKTIIMRPQHGKDPKLFKDFQYLMGERFLGMGLFSIPDYETWKPRRQLYDPGFKKSHLKTMLEPLNEVVNKLIDKLKPLADGTTSVPMRLEFGEFTLNVISKITFGSDFSQQLREIEQQYNILKEDIVTVTFEGLGLSVRYPGYRFYHPFKAAKYRRMARSIRAMGKDCIKNRIQMIESGKQLPNDILSRILQIASTEDSVDIEVLVDDFVTFYTAGQEISASVLTIALVLTLQHPNVLERVLSEIDSVLGTKTFVNAEDLQKLEYTEQVIKETLRLYPAIEGITKKVASGGVTLCGHHIPDGARIMLCSSAMCRMTEHFDDPDTFNPSRFDPSENKRPSSFVYFPFGVGHRSCIGKQFALIMIKIAFSRLLQMYKVALPEDYVLVTVQRGTVQANDNVHCVLEDRL